MGDIDSVASVRTDLSSDTIVLGLGENATANKGIVVADGEKLTLPFRGAVDVMASGASTPVRVQELQGLRQQDSHG